MSRKENNSDEDLIIKNLPEDQRNYLENRWEGQKKYYSKNASYNKKKFHMLQIIVILSGALIPIVNTIDFGDNSTLINDEIRIASSILGGVVLVAASILQLIKYQENWIQYRTTSESLKKEKQLFLYEIGDYDIADSKVRFKLFVERIESSLSTQNTRFFATHAKSPPDLSGSIAKENENDD